MSTETNTKPPAIQAHQWFRNGDHPNDGEECFPAGSEYAGQKYEGQVVRYFRHPEIDGQSKCAVCGKTMHVHGWIDSGGEGQTVCPGDWIVTDSDGIYTAFSPDALTEVHGFPYPLAAEHRQGDWCLYSVVEDTEVIVARSAKEALAFVRWQTGEEVASEQVEETTWDYEGIDETTGETVTMLSLFEEVKARGIREPFQFWTAYN
ncbi:hypothetical protein Q0M94_28385 (plasmid) [Deinococcus radiomollis]|uniref:hypothetical protein n=1 Tax=Deinococcus radiomollis TaxID=468916 RepID=UPI003891B5C1